MRSQLPGGTGIGRAAARMSDLIRVLVVEDSPTVRTLLVEMLESDPDIRVVGVAEDGLDAVRKAARLSPDLITMDVNMPGLDGLAATRKIMSESPTAIIIVSATANQESVALSLDATRAGALMVLPKPAGPGTPYFHDQQQQLVTAAKTMSRVKVVRRWAETGRRWGQRPDIHASTTPYRQAGPARLVAIGCSTGGPAALSHILTALPPTFPLPVAVVQHMARGFVGGLASWLDGATQLRVKVVTEGEELLPGTVYLAADDRHLGIHGEPGRHIPLRARLADDPALSGFRPSASYLFGDAARALGGACIGVVLTGMGDDGAEGLGALHSTHGHVLAQDEASSVVFGMAREAIRAGAVHEVLPLDAIAGRLCELAR